MVHISPARAQQADVEVIAISSAAASFDAQNLASGKAKGAVLRVPSNKADGARLIDGNPTGGWRAVEKFDAAKPAEIVIRLSGKKEVASIFIQPKNWRPGSRVPKEVEILLSSTGPDSGFKTAGKFVLKKKKAWQRIGIKPQKASHIKLRILSLYRPGRPGLGEVAVFAPGVNPVTVAREKAVPKKNRPKFSSIAVNRKGENSAVRIGVDTYRLVNEIAGSKSPKGSRFMVISGYLAEKSAEVKLKLSDVENIFSLQISGGRSIKVHPASKKTARPFWGTLFVEPGAELPVEMVFQLPEEEPLKQVRLQLLSDRGPVSIYIIGEKSTVPSTYLAGPVSKGKSRLAVEHISFVQSHAGKAAPKGRRYLKVKYWFTFLHPLSPIELDNDTLSTLIEDGKKAYRTADWVKGKEYQNERTFLPNEPTAGELVFLVLKKTGQLSLALLTTDGPLSLNLTPSLAAPEPMTQKALLALRASSGIPAPPAKPAPARKPSKPPSRKEPEKKEKEKTTTAVKRKAKKPDIKEKPKAPPARATREPAKTGTTLKQRIEKKLASKGYRGIVVVVRDDRVVVVIGSVKGEKDIELVKKLVAGSADVKGMESHLFTVPTGGLHPKILRDRSNAAVQAAGLTGVQVRMRKRGELILVGQVNSSEEEQLALAIARSQPGISKIVNQLKK